MGGGGGQPELFRILCVSSRRSSSDMQGSEGSSGASATLAGAPWELLLAEPDVPAPPLDEDAGANGASTSSGSGGSSAGERGIVAGDFLKRKLITELFDHVNSC